MIKKILLALGAILIVLQFFGIEKHEAVGHPETDIITALNPPKEVADILINSCYDCHSYNTNYPWYASVAPVSWWVGDHIEEGLEELNFSEWTSYSAEKADHKLEEIAEEAEEGEMPLSSYTITHSEAALSHDQIEILEDWVKQVRGK